MASEERRNELRYRMLVVLNEASGPITYRETLDGIDYSELREIASWLIENGYACHGRAEASLLQPADAS